MNTGTLYLIGVGPGDPELITLKGMKLLSGCQHIFVPKARIANESVALAIAKKYINAASVVHEQIFPMTSNTEELSSRWEKNAYEIAEVLKQDIDAHFITLGDPCLYSTGIYLIRELRKILPDVEICIVPGVTSFNAASALTEFPIGEGKMPVTIIPVDDLDKIKAALFKEGTVVLMKVGEKLSLILDVLEDAGRIEQSVFVARAGMGDQRIETDLRKLKDSAQDAGYLSIILVHNKAEEQI